MSFRVKIISIFFLLCFLLTPSFAQAAGVGFVPSSRLWFSSLVFPPQEATGIYTVIINNNYFYLDATIGFYVDGKLVDTSYISHLAKEHATQVKGSWWPTEGSHAIAVRFIKAVAFDENGNSTPLDVQAFNTVDASDVQVGTLTSASSTTDTNTNSDPKNNLSTDKQSDIIYPSVDLKIEKNGDNLSIVEIKPADTSVAKNDEIKQAFEDKIQSAVQQGEDVRNKINWAFNAVTSTVQTVSNIYDKTKSLLDSKDKYLQEAQNTVSGSKDSLQRVKDYFKTLNNFDILTWFFRILFFVLLVYFVRRFFSRRAE